MDFWDSIEQQVQQANIVIDRKAGSSHPKFREIVYPFNYGYLEGTTGGDGDGIDVWVKNEGASVTGIIVTSDLFKHDTEIKILLGFNLEEMKQLEQFHCVNSQSGLLVVR